MIPMNLSNWNCAMKKLSLIAAAACVFFAEQAVAQTILPNPTAAEASAPRPPRARGIATDLAIEAAEAAIARCRDDGYKVTALVVDSDAVPIAMISGDGAAAITQRIAMGKAMISVKTKMSSGEAAAKAKADSGFNSMLSGDPSLGVPRPGGILIRIGNEIVGALAVSGTPSGDKDEVCARTGLAKIESRLK
jgi:uncharacterized protein GlcG (DUF336 family)